MTVKEFKEKCEYWLDCCISDCATDTEDREKISQLINIIKLIEEDVIVKGDDIENHYVEGISLNAIINDLSAGYEVINIKEI